ncbi:MAG: TonB-dependent receptor [Bacteroidota bacterium]
MNTISRLTFLVIIPALLLGSRRIAYSQEVLSDTIDLHPVTIVALHPLAGEMKSLHLDYLDKMEHDGGALLDNIPGISSIRKSGGYGFDPVIRGFKYDQINMVFNGGLSATAACPNRMDPPTSQMAPNMIQRIEILKGPHALRYGCSFGATVNFIPVSPVFSEASSVYGRLSGGLESNGNIMRSEGLLGFNGKRYDLGLFASWSQGDDYNSGEDHVIPAAFLRGSFGSRLGLKLSKNQVLKFTLTRNLARDADFAALPMDLRKDDTWLLNADHEISFLEGPLKSWNTSIYGSHVNHLMDNFEKKLDPRMVNAETLATTLNYGGRSEGTWRFENSLLYTGIDFRMEGAEGSREREFLMGPNQGKILSDNVWQEGQITRAGLFTEYHLHSLGINWVFSGRLELNSSQISDADPDFAELYPETSSTRINPGISIGGTRRINEYFSTGLWLGRAHRSGSLTEKFINYFPVGQDPYEMLGNPMLDPEINNQADLNFQWKSENTSLKLDLFTAYLQDFISSSIDISLSPRLPSSPGVRRFINVDKAFKSGFEASWGQRLFVGLTHQLSLAYTYGQDLVRKEPLPEIAPLDLRYHLSGSYVKNHLQPYATFRYAMEQDRISGEFGETVTPSFFIVDLGLSLKINRLIGIRAGVQNLLDELYYEHLNRSVKSANPFPIYAPGRSFFLSFNLAFNPGPSRVP